MRSCKTGETPEKNLNTVDSPAVNARFISKVSLTVYDQLSQRQRDRRFLTINIYFV